MITTKINEGSAKMARRYEIDDAQWEKDEKLKQLFESVRKNPDMQDLCIDGTYIKAHRSSAGAKKGLWNMMTISISESAGEEDPPKSAR